MNERVTSVALSYAKGFGTDGCGASGILISNDTIISHGSLANGKLKNSPKIREFFEKLIPGELKIVPEWARDDLKLRVYRRRTRNYEKLSFDENKENSQSKSRVNFEKSMNICNSDLVEEEGKIVVAWRCPSLEKTFRELFYSWNFDKTRNNERSLLSIFLIVRVGKIANSAEVRSTSEDEIFRTRRILQSFVENFDLAMINPARGCAVEISSTPFGNPVFIDSISRGVVSNLVGDDECVMLTDANAVPGSEGAPVYVTRQELVESVVRVIVENDITLDHLVVVLASYDASFFYSFISGTRGYVCGMVIAPLSWCRGEWVDYTFVATLFPCLRRLLPLSRINQQIVNTPTTEIADSLDKSLVLVRCGDGWGTGIIFDARTGTIITCAHVVHKAPESRIKVVLRRDDDSRSSGSSSSTTSSSSSSLSSSWAKLVYRTARGEPYDVAVLRLERGDTLPTLRSIKIADDGPVLRGEAVGSAGFPFFSSRFPTITRGNVSGISDCMLRTTCCVQSGSSGGPIVRWSNGEMLGMVVCNAITTNKTKLYPRLNMAVPVSILKPPISEYLRTGKVKALDALATNDSVVRRTWNFHHLPSSKI